MKVFLENGEHFLLAVRKLEIYVILTLVRFLLVGSNRQLLFVDIKYGLDTGLFILKFKRKRKNIQKYMIEE